MVNYMLRVFYLNLKMVFKKFCVHELQSKTQEQFQIKGAERRHDYWVQGVSSDCWDNLQKVNSLGNNNSSILIS